MKIKRRKKRSGQAMVEFAFLLGLYLFMIGFMFGGFQIMHSKIVMDIGAYNGARYASLYKADKVQAQKEAKSVLELNAFKESDPRVTFEYDGNYTSCIVTEKVHLIFPILDPNTAVTLVTEKELSTKFTIRNENTGR